MSKIPFLFRTIPDEFLTDAFLEDIYMMRLIRYILQRIRPFEHEEQICVNHCYKTVILKPFEWIYGRDKASKECKCSHDIIRTRITQLLTQRFLEKIPSPCPSHFSVYRLVTESFQQINPQPLPHPLPQPLPQPLPHKVESKSVRSYRNKEANAAIAGAAASFHNCLLKLQLSLEDKVDISRYPEDVVQRALWWAEIKKKLTVTYIKGACNPKNEEYGNVIYNRWWVEHEIVADNDWAKKELLISGDFLKHKDMPDKEICFKCKPEAFQTQFFQVFVNVGAANEN